MRAVLLSFLAVAVVAAGCSSTPEDAPTLDGDTPVLTVPPSGSDVSLPGFAPPGATSTTLSP